MDNTTVQDGFKVSSVFLCLISTPVTIYEGFNLISLNNLIRSYTVAEWGTKRKAVRHTRMFYDALGQAPCASRMTPGQEHLSLGRIKRQEKRGYS